MGARPNIYLFPFWTCLDEVKWTYLVIPISSIKGESDGQEGLQHHCLLGKSFSCTKTSQQSVNILQYFDFQLLAGKALRQGADQILVCPLVELILMKSSEYTLWYQSYQSKASQMVKKVYNTTAFWGTLSPAQRKVNNQWMFSSILIFSFWLEKHSDPSLSISR